MKGYKANIEKQTLENENFRQVRYTSKNFQLVLMALKPKEEIGLETHPDNDQFFRFEQGHGKVFIDQRTTEVSDGDAVIVPAGAKHNIVNISETEYLKFYTIYGPPHHKDKTVHKLKKDALTSEEEFDGITSE
ncbi:MAG: cupin domain-containing protein [bacterium]|nr:MAG: cupin domain-containing protein [bacterium]